MFPFLVTFLNLDITSFFCSVAPTEQIKMSVCKVTKEQYHRLNRDVTELRKLGKNYTVEPPNDGMDTFWTAVLSFIERLSSL